MSVKVSLWVDSPEPVIMKDDSDQPMEVLNITVTNDGLWDVDAIDIAGSVRKNGHLTAEVRHRHLILPLPDDLPDVVRATIERARNAADAAITYLNESRA